MYVCVCVSICHVCTGAHRGQKRVSETLELELLAIVGCQMWVLGTKF